MTAELPPLDNSKIILNNLRIAFGDTEVVKGVSFSVAPGECFGIVGESGSGKSTILRALAGLNQSWSGGMVIGGEDQVPVRQKRFFRRVQMVFQDPYGSLHPRQTVDRQLLEPLAIHGIGDGEKRILKALDEVGLGSSFRFRYPHQLSGGQRQRVAIARALIVEPEILLLDEPTSALDASVQAEVLNLLEDVRSRHGLTYIMVSHDLGVVSHMCDRLAVMRGGEVVETILPDSLVTRDFSADYTRQLLVASEGFRRD